MIISIYAEKAYKKLKQKTLSLDNDGVMDADAFDKYNKEFISYINDDMNTSSSLTVLYDVLKDDSLNDVTKKALVESFDKVLSLDLLKQEEIKVDDELIKYVEKQIELRLEAKKNKDFLTADKIRDELLEKGISLKDTKEGTTWSKK